MARLTTGRTVAQVDALTSSIVPPPLALNPTGRRLYCSSHRYRSIRNVRAMARSCSSSVPVMASSAAPMADSMLRTVSDMGELTVVVVDGTKLVQEVNVISVACLTALGCCPGICRAMFCYSACMLLNCLHVWFACITRQWISTSVLQRQLWHLGVVSWVLYLWDLSRRMGRQLRYKELKCVVADFPASKGWSGSMIYRSQMYIVLRIDSGLPGFSEGRIQRHWRDGADDMCRH